MVPEIRRASAEESFVLNIASWPVITGISVNNKVIQTNFLTENLGLKHIPVQRTAQAFQDAILSTTEQRKKVGDLSIGIPREESGTFTIAISFSHPQGAWFIGNEFVFPNVDGDISQLFPIPVSTASQTQVVVFKNLVSSMDIKCDVVSRQSKVSFSPGTTKRVQTSRYSSLGILYARANHHQISDSKSKFRMSDKGMDISEIFALGEITRRFSSTKLDESTEHYLPLFGVVAGGFVVDKVTVYEHSAYLVVPDAYCDSLNTAKSSLASIPANLALIARLLPGIKIKTIIVAFVRSVQKPKACENILLLPDSLLDYASSSPPSFTTQRYLQQVLAHALVLFLYRAHLRPAKISDVGACMLLEGMLSGYLLGRLFGDDEAKVLAMENSLVAVTLDDGINPPLLFRTSEEVSIFKGNNIIEPALVPRLDSNLYGALSYKAKAIAASMSGLCSERVADSVLVNTARTGNRIEGSSILAELSPSRTAVQMLTTLGMTHLLGSALYEEESVGVAIRSAGKPNTVPRISVRYYDEPTYFREDALSADVVSSVSFHQIVSYADVPGIQSVQSKTSRLARVNGTSWVTIDPDEQFTAIICRFKQPIHALMAGLKGEKSLLARLSFAHSLTLKRPEGSHFYDDLVSIVRGDAPPRLKEAVIELIAVHASNSESREPQDAFMKAEDAIRGMNIKIPAVKVQLKKALREWHPFAGIEDSLHHSPPAILGRAASRMGTEAQEEFLAELRVQCDWETNYPAPGHTLFIAIVIALVRLALVSAKLGSGGEIEIARSLPFQHIMSRLGEDDIAAGMLNMRMWTFPLIAILIAIHPNLYNLDILQPFERGLDSILLSGDPPICPEAIKCFSILEEHPSIEAEHLEPNANEQNGYYNKDSCANDVDCRCRAILLFLKAVVLYCALGFSDIATVAANCVEFLLLSYSVVGEVSKKGRSRPRTVSPFVFTSFHDALLAATGDPAEPLASFSATGLGIFLDLFSNRNDQIPCFPCIAGGSCSAHIGQVGTHAFHLLPPITAVPLIPLILSEIQRFSASGSLPYMMTHSESHLDSVGVVAKIITSLVMDGFPSLPPTSLPVKMALLRGLVNSKQLTVFQTKEARMEVKTLFNETRTENSPQRPQIPRCSFDLTFNGTVRYSLPVSSIIFQAAGP